MDYRLEYINETTLPQALRLLRDFFGKSYYGANDKYVKWQYFDSPFKARMTAKDDYSILVFMDKGQNIMALDAFLPWVTCVNGKEVTTVWDIEWMNFSEMRGLGKEIVKSLRKRTEIYCGYGMNELSLRSYEKLGYSARNEIERKIAILDAGKCMELFGNDEIEGQKDFLKGVEIESVAGNTGYFEIKDPGNISGKYWKSHMERCDITSLKDRRVLKWRYFDHPYINYDLIAMDPEAGKGLAVVRVERIKDQKENVLRVLELFPVQGYERDLVKAVISFGIDKGAVMSDFFCVSKRSCEEICPEPFVSLAEHREYQVPMLFQPIEVRERKSINMVLDCNEGLDDVSFNQFCATKGDGDQDVFVNPDYRTVSL